MTVMATRHGVVLAALLLASLAWPGCDKERSPPAPAPTSVGSAAPEVPAPLMGGEAPAPITGASIYDLDLALRNQDGDEVGLDAYRGHPVLIAMFYAGCPAACPRLIDDVLAVEKALSPELRTRLRVLLVSFDAARDTPVALRKVMSDRNLDQARWMLSAVPDDGARELAAVLGVKYRHLDDGEFFHTSVITALDGVGRPLARVEGLGQPPDVLVAALR